MGMTYFPRDKTTWLTTIPALTNQNFMKPREGSLQEVVKYGPAYKG